MIATVQRVSSASVYLKDNPENKSTIGPGIVVLLGVGQADDETDVEKLALKLSKLRIFSDQAGKMNLDILSASQSLLLISQFTLFADITGGNRPSFIKAAAPEFAKSLYEKLSSRLSQLSVPIKNGFFGGYMLIEAVLDGPVTINLDSKQL